VSCSYQQRHHESDIAACLDARSAYSEADISLLPVAEFHAKVSRAPKARSRHSDCRLALQCFFRGYCWRGRLCSGMHGHAQRRCSDADILLRGQRQQQLRLQLNVYAAGHTPCCP
jgi:hypothetical protein